MRDVLKVCSVVLVAVALVAVTPVPATADLVTMHTANITVGNQAWSSVGLQFDVNPGAGIRVEELGVYDSRGDGITGGATLSTLIFNASQTVLAQTNFTAASQGTYDPASNYLFKALVDPLVLTPGRYTIVSYGFASGDNEHNSNNGGTSPTFDDGGGLISFHQSVWGGGHDAPPVFPTSPGGYSQLPDYFDGPNMRFSVVPVPGAILLGMVGLGGSGGLLAWRKRKTL